MSRLDLNASGVSTGGTGGRVPQHSGRGEQSRKSPPPPPFET